MGITFHGATGQTLYARVQTAATTFTACALTEGSSGGLGVYNATDAALVSAGISASDGDYVYTVRSGTASATVNDTIVGSGVLGWTGTVERGYRPGSGGSGGIDMVRKNGATSNAIRVKLCNINTGQGLTGL